MVELRSDARRNLERVLDAATEVFAAEGPEASIDEIARRAGVGRRVAEMQTLAKEALAAEDPGEAFFDFVHRVAELSMSAPGLHRCVVHCGDKPGAAELEKLTARIVVRAQRAGAVRTDVKPEDVRLLVRSALTSAPEGHWRRHLAVVLDGLRA
jgi:hypothetical protein